MFRYSDYDSRTLDALILVTEVTKWEEKFSGLMLRKHPETAPLLRKEKRGRLAFLLKSQGFFEDSGAVLTSAHLCRCV